MRTHCHTGGCPRPLSLWAREPADAFAVRFPSGRIMKNQCSRALSPWHTGLVWFQDKHELGANQPPALIDPWMHKYIHSRVLCTHVHTYMYQVRTEMHALHIPSTMYVLYVCAQICTHVNTYTHALPHRLASQGWAISRPSGRFSFLFIFLAMSLCRSSVDRNGPLVPAPCRSCPYSDSERWVFGQGRESWSHGSVVRLFQHPGSTIQLV